MLPSWVVTGGNRRGERRLQHVGDPRSLGGYPGRLSGLGVLARLSLRELSTTRTITVHRPGGGQLAEQQVK